MSEPLPDSFSYGSYNPETLRVFKIFKPPIKIKTLNEFEWIRCEAKGKDLHPLKADYPYVTACRYNRECLYPYILERIIPDDETERFIKFWQDDIEYNKGDEEYDQESSNWWTCNLLQKTRNSVDAAHSIKVKNTGAMRAYLFDWEMQLMLSCVSPNIIFDSQGWMSAPQLVPY